MTQKKTRKLAAVASSIIVVVGGLTTGAVTANAAPQDHAKPRGLSAACASDSYEKPSGYSYYPTGFPDGSWLVTSYRCGAIWVMPRSNRNVKVCYRYSHDTVCQTNYKFAVANTWTRLASGVSGGTEYKLRFQTSGLATGMYHG